MANCHKEFLKYNQTLNVNPTMMKRLKSAQRSVEKRLRFYFKDRNGYRIERFKVQGSKSLSTLIRRRNETVDIDFGVYFYPKPNVKPTTLMEHVYKALNEIPTTYYPKRKNK